MQADEGGGVYRIIYVLRYQPGVSLQQYRCSDGDDIDIVQSISMRFGKIDSPQPCEVSIIRVTDSLAGLAPTCVVNTFIERNGPSKLVIPQEPLVITISSQHAQARPQVPLVSRSYAVETSSMRSAMLDLAQIHLDLISIKVSGIPMKKNNASSNSKENFDVVFLSQGAVHITPQVVMEDTKETGSSSFVLGRQLQSPFMQRREMQLEWSKLDKATSPHMLPCRCVHRVSPYDLCSNPTICLLTHVMAGKAAALRLKRGSNSTQLGAANQTVSHVLLIHGDVVYLHCLQGASFPSLLVSADQRRAALTETKEASQGISEGIENMLRACITQQTMRFLPGSLPGQGGHQTYLRLPGTRVLTTPTLERQTRWLPDVSSLLFDSSLTRLRELTEAILILPHTPNPNATQRVAMVQSLRQIASMTVNGKCQLFEKSVVPTKDLGPISYEEAAVRYRQLWPEIVSFFFSHGDDSELPTNLFSALDKTLEYVKNSYGVSKNAATNDALVADSEDRLDATMGIEAGADSEIHLHRRGPLKAAVRARERERMLARQEKERQERDRERQMAETATGEMVMAMWNKILNTEKACRDQPSKTCALKRKRVESAEGSLGVEAAETWRGSLYSQYWHNLCNEEERNAPFAGRLLTPLDGSGYDESYQN